MIRALLDTNVLASAIAGASNQNNTPGELFRRWRKGSFVLVTSDHILAEIARTLRNPYFRERVSDIDAYQALRAFQRWGEHALLSVDVIGVASHPEDDLVLSAAISARVDYLVTGDRMLLKLRTFEDVTILNPSVFLSVLDSAGSLKDD